MTPVSSGPDWATILTAIGTVATAIAAVGIALWTDKRTGQRVADERKESRKQLASEQAFSRSQLEAERQQTRDREQYSEAYAVRVVPLQQARGYLEVHRQSQKPELTRLAVAVVNRGSYTITGISAQFSTQGNDLFPASKSERISPYEDLPNKLRAGWGPSAETAMQGILTPWDTGLRFETDEIAVQYLTAPYPVVQWTDRWGTRWEHRRGQIRKLRDDEQWTPGWNPPDS